MAIVESGFKYIDYSFSYDYNNDTGLLGDNRKEYADKLLDMSKKYGFKFVQAHAPMGKPLVCDENQSCIIEMTKRSIKQRHISVFRILLSIRVMQISYPERKHLLRIKSFMMKFWLLPIKSA